MVCENIYIYIYMEYLHWKNKNFKHIFCLRCKVRKGQGRAIEI